MQTYFGKGNASCTSKVNETTNCLCLPPASPVGSQSAPIIPRYTGLVFDTHVKPVLGLGNLPRVFLSTTVTSKGHRRLEVRALTTSSQHCDLAHLIQIIKQSSKISSQEDLATTWARRRKRPVFRRVTYDRRALSTAVALIRSGKIYKRHFEGAIHSAQVIETLKHLQRHVSGSIILIWDRARIHTSKKVRDYLVEHPEIHIELLPAYAPELNPEEYCHGNIKRRLKNARPANKTDIRRMLDRGFARLRRRPDLLLSFFRAAGFPVRQLRLI